MNIMTALQLLGLVIVILLYRKMKKNIVTDTKNNEDTKELMAGIEEESVEL